MTKVLQVIQGVDIELRYSNSGDELVEFLADADIDGDGLDDNGKPNNVDNDKYYQSDTKLHRDGHALNAQKEAYVVVPPVVVKKTKGIVMGSLCLVQNLLTKDMCFAVVGDVGPTFKVGELSPACARQVNVNPNAKTGGESRKIIGYTIFIGQPAKVNGYQYTLQKA